jgi:hypothetical protein
VNPRTRRRFRRIAPGVAAAGLALAGVLWVGAHAAANRPGARIFLRDRIQAALRDRLGDARVGEDVRVDWVLRVRFGPVELSPEPGAPPVVTVERAIVRPDLAALLRGRVAAASVVLDGVCVDAAAGWDRVRSLAERVRHRPDPGGNGARDGGPRRLRFRRLAVRLPAAGGTAELGPVDGEVVQQGDRMTAALVLPGGGRAELAVVRGPGGLAARFHAARLSAEACPSALRGDALGITAGTFAIDATATAAPDLSRADAHATVAIRGLELGGARVGPEPVGPIQVDATGDVRVDRAARRIAFDADATTFDAVRVRVDGSVDAAEDLPFRLAIRADDVDFRRLAAALPAALAPPDEAPRPQGTFAARVDVSGPLVRPADWIVDGGLDLSHLREAARRAPPVALRSSFTYTPPDDERVPSPPFRVGPENPDFVPLSELPEHVVRAVTTAEDAGFYGHAGFDLDGLRYALASDAAGGRVVRGGSTITQQLAKNLWLSREKTFARKIREAMATVALEATVPKGRLLEIYLNVVEWGPGVHGIGPAARHWFGKDARALTPKEAAFLASVIPNPVRYHVMYARREVSEKWEGHVDELLLKMNAAGVISEDELVRALAEPIVFAGG